MIAEDDELRHRSFPDHLARDAVLQCGRTFRPQPVQAGQFALREPISLGAQGAQRMAHRLLEAVHSGGRRRSGEVASQAAGLPIEGTIHSPG
jgi:hypothetical protein